MLSVWPRFPVIVLAFAGGVLGVQQQASLYPRWAYLTVLLVGLAAWLMRRTAISTALNILLALIIGVAWAQWRAEWRLADRLLPELEQEEVSVTGVIRGVPVVVPGIQGDGVRFRFDVEQAPHGVPSSLSLSWYARGMNPAPQVRAAERWRFTVRLKRPHGAANPRGFDVERWMLEEGLRATGVVRTSVRPERLAERVTSIRASIDRLRQMLGENLLQVLSPSPYAGVIAALVMGEQRYVDADDWALFNRTGIGHLLSISGLHITMLAGLAAALAAWAWRWAVQREQRWAMRTTRRQVAACVGLISAFAYTLMAGFAVPAQRTLYMLCAVALALLTGRTTQPFHVLACALLLVLLLDPWAVGAAGFWLSFMAVACLMLSTPVNTMPSGWRGRLRMAAIAQMAVTLGLLPVSLWFFQQASVVGPLANALAIPVVSFMVTPLSLLGSVLWAVSGWPVPLQMAEAVLSALMTWIERLGQWEGAAVEFAAPALGLVVLGAIGAVWAIQVGRPVWQRGLGLVCLIPMLLTPVQRPPADGFDAIAFDVGQGSAVLVRTRHHTLLYDTGPRWSAQTDAGARLIVPYLRAHGVRTLDALVISHDDSDHAGGALSLLEQRNVLEVRGVLPEEHEIVRLAPRFESCESGQQWVWDNIRFEVLHPSPETVARNDNGRSCVLKISSSQHSLLLTGDIESAQESEMLSRWPEYAWRADVMLVPHHGSKSSSSESFVAAVKPTAVVVQAGYLNRFHHPRPEIVARYEEHGAQVWRTDRQGAILMHFSPRGWGIESQRQREPRYWHGL